MGLEVGPSGGLDDDSETVSTPDNILNVKKCRLLFLQSVPVRLPNPVGDSNTILM